MKSDKHDKKLDTLISDAISRDDLAFDFDKWKQTHQKEIREYESQAAQAPHHSRSRTLWKSITQSTISKLAAAAVIIIALLVTIKHFAGPTGLTNIAWADVTERFRSVPFFSAAIYIKEDATAEPKQIELWMSRDGRTRLRTAAQVIFGNQGKVTKAFDIKSRTAVEPDEHAAFLLGKLGNAEEFSLDVVMNVMFGGELEDVTPLVNPDAVISEDMVVFDIQSTISPEWLRIWALRESRLPVRIRVWDPRDGAAADAVFTYSKEQPDEFFDPNAFERLLKSTHTGSKVNIAYAFLKDPGGRNVTPEEMFAKSGYHIPVIKHTGLTKDGAFWVLAGESRNRMPNGNSFYGFSRLEDDLARTYISVGGGHRLRGDTSLNVFVPVDFPFDKRRPSRFKLFCETKEYNPNVKPELIGVVELTEWEQNAICPNLFGEGTQDPLGFKIALAYQLAGKEHAERRAKLLETIPKWSERPKDVSVLIFWIRTKASEKDFDEVIAIGEVLTPLLLERPRQAGRYMFRDYIVALAKTGRLDEAKALFERIDKVEELTPEKDKKDYYNGYLQHIARALSHEAKLTVDKVGYVMSVDIKNDRRFDNFRGWDWSGEYKKPVYDSWRRHLKELADYYKRHPLPEKMELLPLKTSEDFKAYTRLIPEIPTHQVQLLSGSLHDYLAPWGLSVAGKLRLPEELGQIDLQYDLIYANKVGIKERYTFVLDRLGLEIAEANEPRKVWVAHYDGRKLKPYTQVKAPRPYDNKGQYKTGMAVGWGAFSMVQLLERFTRDQNRELNAAGVIIVDETGIKSIPDKPSDRKSVAVSSELPCWEGKQAIELARKWFKDEFGVTFTEQTHTMKTYVIRRRQ
ncbi:MAG: hypothetical protein KAY65_14790 [Planctomycetes bacterium]|nr:hypothetical protein [Planctomycetota bacterium]